MRMRTYKYRIYPTKAQVVLLEKHFGCSRFIYNYGLALKTRAYRRGIKASCFDLMAKLPKLKSIHPWLSEVSSQSLQQSLRNLDNAYTNFFKKRSEFPRFKSRKHAQSYRTLQHTRIDFDSHIVYILKFKEGIRYYGDRTFQGKIKTATISKSASGKYFISILVETDEEARAKPPIQDSTTIGIDMGIRSLVTVSDGRKIDNPRFGAAQDKKLRMLHHRMSKKQKGSKNWNKARIKLARYHEYVANQRADYIHKLTTSLVLDSSIDTICVEDLSISTMVHKSHISSRIYDAAWNILIRQLAYKCEWYGKNLIKIGRFDPSSKICSNCGYYNKGLGSEAVWTCPECSTELDRDLNAAKNIKAFGLVSYTGTDRPGELGEIFSLEKSVNQEVLE